MSKNDKEKKLRLDLDNVIEQGYIYTKFDIGGEGHAVTIKAQDKEKFLDEYAKLTREMVEKCLEEVEDDE